MIVCPRGTQPNSFRRNGRNRPGLPGRRERRRGRTGRGHFRTGRRKAMWRPRDTVRRCGCLPRGTQPNSFRPNGRNRPGLPERRERRRGRTGRGRFRTGHRKAMWRPRDTVRRCGCLPRGTQPNSFRPNERNRPGLPGRRERRRGRTGRGRSRTGHRKAMWRPRDTVRRCGCLPRGTQPNSFRPNERKAGSPRASGAPTFPDRSPKSHVAPERYSS